MQVQWLARALRHWTKLTEMNRLTADPSFLAPLWSMRLQTQLRLHQHQCCRAACRPAYTTHAVMRHCTDWPAQHQTCAVLRTYTRASSKRGQQQHVDDAPTLLLFSTQVSLELGGQQSGPAASKAASDTKCLPSLWLVAQHWLRVTLNRSRYWSRYRILT
jgi:hypothetical protein